jgi:hypothetical protein
VGQKVKRDFFEQDTIRGEERASISANTSAPYFDAMIQMLLLWNNYNTELIH